MPNRNSESGFSLLETLIATFLLAGGVLATAQMFILATKSNSNSMQTTYTAALAQEKMEQLRSLTWGFDTEGQGLPVSDTSSNLSIDPPDASGNGLNPSPSDTLRNSTGGYVDFLDAHGGYVGTGTTAPPEAVFVRRWSVQPLPTNPNNTLILQVFVTPVANDKARMTGGAGAGQELQRLPGDALLVSVKTRKAQ